jgi:drug/metabolite transporter (DMT)-like permease
MPDSPSKGSHGGAEAGRLRGYLLALLAAACWATGGLTAKWLFTTPGPENAAWPIQPLGIAIDPTALSGGRALSAAVILGLYLVARDRAALRTTARDLAFFAVFGIAGLAAVHYTYFKTISLTDVATAILLEYLAPIIVLAVGVLFLGHRFTWTLPVGVALSVSGCALVVGAVGGQGLQVSPAGIAWGLSSAVFFAGYSLLGGVASTRYQPLTLLFYGLGFAALFWLGVLGPAPVLRLFGSPATALAVLSMAIISTIIPFAAFLVALRHIAPTNATVTSTVEPALAGIGAYMLFGETMTAIQLLGGVLVVAAIIVVQLPQADPAIPFPPQD